MFSQARKQIFIGLNTLANGDIYQHSLFKLSIFLDIHTYKYQMVGYMTLLTPLLFLFKKEANVFNTKSYISSLP